MTDLPSITAILSGLKIASDITKTLSQSDANLERAELKNKLADVVVALADVKMAAVELRDSVVAKDQEIARLLEAVEIKGEVVKGGDAYFKKNERGEGGGPAFCLHCWDSRKKLTHLIRGRDSRGIENMQCPSCKTAYMIYNILWPKA